MSILAASMRLAQAPSPHTQDDRDAFSRDVFQDELRLCGRYLERALLSQNDRSAIKARAEALRGSPTAVSAWQGACSAVAGPRASGSEQSADVIAAICAASRIADEQERAEFLRQVSHGLKPTAGPALDRLEAAVWHVSRPAAAALASNALQRAAHNVSAQLVFAQTASQGLSRLARDFPADQRMAFVAAAEAQRTHASAARYVARCRDALSAIGRANGRQADSHCRAIHGRPALVVSLSALDPDLRRHDLRRPDRPLALPPALLELVKDARLQGCLLIFDEEPEYLLEPALTRYAALLATPEADGWNGLGFTVRAFSRRLLAALARLWSLASTHERVLPVRLARGGTWTSDVQAAIAGAWPGYPVMTSAHRMSVAFVAAARWLLESDGRFHALLTPETPFERAACEVLGKAKTFDLVAPAAGGTPNRPNGHGGAQYRVEAWIGDADLVLGAWHDRAIEPRVRASLRSCGSEAAGDAELADPIAAVEAAYDRAQTQIPVDWLRVPGRIGASDDCKRASAAVLMSEAAVASWRTVLPEPGDPGEPGDLSEARHVGETEDQGAAAKARTHGDDRNDGRDVMARAHAAFSAWQTRPVNERAAYLHHVADALLRARAATIADLVADTGMLFADAEAEWRVCVDVLGEIASLGRQTDSIATLSVEEVPVGTVAVSCDAAVPLIGLIAPAAAALMAGNCVVMSAQPSFKRVADLVIGLFDGACEAGGCPSHLVQICQSDVASHDELVLDERIGALAVSRPRRLIRSVVSQRLKHGFPSVPVVSLETCRPGVAIVSASADLGRAAQEITRSVIAYAGQRPGALRHILVDHRVGGMFETLLAEQLADVAGGPAGCLQSDMGPSLDRRARDSVDAEKMRLAGLGEILFDAGAFPDAAYAPRLAGPALIRVNTLNDGRLCSPGPIVVVQHGAPDDVAVTLRIMQHIGHLVLFSQRAGALEALRQQCGQTGVSVERLGQSGPVGALPVLTQYNALRAWAARLRPSDFTARQSMMGDGIV